MEAMWVVAALAVLLAVGLEFVTAHDEDEQPNDGHGP